MDRSDPRLRVIFREVLEDPTLELSDDLRVGRHPNWDSLASIQLILAVEAAFGIKFTVDQVASLHSAADVARIVAQAAGTPPAER